MPNEITNSSFNTSDEILEEVEIELPPDYNVIIFNDDFTTKDFVIEVLMDVFHKAFEEAVQLMERVHKTGSAVVGTYTYDIAATRVAATIDRARKEGFPLRCEMENA
ncbi:MAG: ATP-dependent Clp protease adaptor ClpS [Treponema sp.]|nr:ATP-dependent Clp protease adaptor ClpS [Treponema sp.]